MIAARIAELAALYCRSESDLREWHTERASIREYEAGLSRAEAERLALEDVADELEGRR